MKPARPRDPARTPAQDAPDDDRAARLKAALRANLARRKGQARARAAQDGTDAAPGANDKRQG